GIQYKNQSYEIDKYLLPGELPVAQGEIIALSGNSAAVEAHTCTSRFGPP
ncbi:MAG: hypothetical protein HC896_06430, partial [Bacteroidales bacterium]|nr:hypothetical protein [Bacteroidales bacterium]